MKITTQIQSARKIITDLFVNQCKEVSTQAGLPENIYACGQYLGVENAQRGGHGTAAALHVLSTCSSETEKNIAAGLANYICDRKNIESSLTDEENDNLKSVNDDFDNTIKVCETLCSLNNVYPAVYNKEQCAKDLSNKLLSSQINEKGWGYYLGDTGEIELLPTAFAVKALSSFGEDASKPVDYLIKSLENNTSQDFLPGNSDISIKVFILYVVLYCNCTLTQQQENIVDKAYKDLWVKLQYLLDEDIEQTIEYLGNNGQKNRYIRVPWQLYMIAVILKKAPYGAMSNLVVFKKAKHILKSINEGNGFIYPHSGKYVASRTSAITFDILELIEKRENQFIYDGLAYLGKAIRFIGSPLIRILSTIVAVIIIFFVIYNADNVTTTGIATSLISSVLLFLLSLGKTR